MTSKMKCKCPTHGCAHLISWYSGLCRLMDEGKCVMDYKNHLNHYLCCPFLNSPEGRATLAEYKNEHGIKE
jgi:hypothetical protein